MTPENIPTRNVELEQKMARAGRCTVCGHKTKRYVCRQCRSLDGAVGPSDQYGGAGLRSMQCEYANQLGYPNGVSAAPVAPGTWDAKEEEEGLDHSRAGILRRTKCRNGG